MMFVTETGITFKTAQVNASIPLRTWGESAEGERAGLAVAAGTEGGGQFRSGSPNTGTWKCSPDRSHFAIGEPRTANPLDEL